MTTRAGVPEAAGLDAVRAEHLRAGLDANGYVVIEAGAVAVVEAGCELANAIDPTAEARFTSSVRDAAAAERLQLDRAVKALLRPVLAGLLGPQRVFLGGLLDKGPGAPELPFHQDLSYTDERSHRSFTAWVPLVDVRSNGSLAVVPASHRWATGIRPAGPGGTHVPDRLRRDLAARASRLDVAAGSVVIWDNAVIHGSLPNRTSNPRPVLAASFADPAATLTYYHSEQAGHLEGFLLDDDYVRQDDAFLSRPRGYTAVEPWAPVAPAFDPDQVDALWR